ncbi:MAG TPA: hypothetical protein VD908_13210 [Cytophagales bacterium]|nr:hypothetical protein [Cytophagales bacterium]
MKTRIDIRLFIHVVIALVFTYYSIFKRQEYEYSWLLAAVAIMSFIWVIISIVNNVKNTGVFYKKKMWDVDDYNNNNKRTSSKS